MYIKLEEKKKALELRKNGFSVKNIATKLNVSIGSVSLWTKGLILTAEQSKKLKEHNKSNYEIGFDKHRKKLSQEKKLRIDGYIKHGEILASQDQLFRIVCSLYWGEGDKTSEYFKISNCDYTMHQLVWYWLCENGYKDRVVLSVLYHEENLIAEQEILNWWVKMIQGLSVEQCKLYTKKSSVNKKVGFGKIPYGVGYMGVYSIELFYKIMGGIEYLKKNVVNLNLT